MEGGTLELSILIVWTATASRAASTCFGSSCLICTGAASVCRRGGALKGLISTLGSDRAAMDASSNEGCHCVSQSSGKLSGGGGTSVASQVSSTTGLDVYVGAGFSAT